MNNLTLVIRGHTRDSLFNNDLYDFITEISKHFNLNIYIHTWKYKEASASWRPITDTKTLITTENNIDELKKYFINLPISNININDEDDKNLIGNLKGTVSSTKMPLKNWKFFIFNIYDSLKNLDENEIILSFRFDLIGKNFILKQDISGVITSLKNIYNNINKIHISPVFNTSISADNIILGTQYFFFNTFKLLHYKLDSILINYPVLRAQEFICRDVIKLTSSNKITFDTIFKRQKIAILIRGHIRNTTSDNDFSDFINELNQLYDIDIYIHTWDQIDANKRWDRNDTNNSYSINHVKDIIDKLKLPNIKNIIIDNDKNIEKQLIGNTTGYLTNNGIVNISLIGWKYMWYGQYTCIKSIKTPENYDLFLNIRFDYFQVTKKHASYIKSYSKDSIINTIERYFIFNNKHINFLCDINICIDNCFMGDYKNMLDGISHFHLKLDDFIHLYKHFRSHEKIVWYEFIKHRFAFNNPPINFIDDEFKNNFKESSSVYVGIFCKIRKRLWIKTNKYISAHSNQNTTCIITDNNANIYTIDYIDYNGGDLYEIICNTLDEAIKIYSEKFNRNKPIEKDSLLYKSYDEYKDIFDKNYSRYIGIYCNIRKKIWIKYNKFTGISQKPQCTCIFFENNSSTIKHIGQIDFNGSDIKCFNADSLQHANNIYITYSKSNNINTTINKNSNYKSLDISLDIPKNIVFYIKNITQFINFGGSNNFCHSFWGHFCPTISLITEYYEKKYSSDLINNYVLNPNIQLIFQEKPNCFKLLSELYKNFYINDISWNKNYIDNHAIILNFDNNRYEYTAGLIKNYLFLPYVNKGTNILRNYFTQNYINTNDKKLLIYNSRSNGRTILNEKNLINELTLFCNQYNLNFQCIDTGNMLFKDQLEILSKTNIYITAHGSACVLKSLLPDDAIIIEYQPGNSWHTGFLFIEDYNRLTHILSSKKKIIPSTKYNNNIYQLYEKTADDTWSKNRGISRNINISKTIFLLKIICSFNKSYKENIFESIESITWLSMVYNNRGINLIED